MYVQGTSLTQIRYVWYSWDQQLVGLDGPTSPTCFEELWHVWFRGRVSQYLSSSLQYWLRYPMVRLVSNYGDQLETFALGNGSRNVQQYIGNYIVIRSNNQCYFSFRMYLSRPSWDDARSIHIARTPPFWKKEKSQASMPPVLPQHIHMQM